MTGPAYTPFSKIRLSQIKAAVWGGMRYDHILAAGWEIRPSIGIIARRVNKLALQIADYKVPLVESVRVVMMPSIRQNFLHEGRPTAWEPLSLAAEKIRGSARPILYRSGLLENVASSFGIWSFTKTGATIRDLPPEVWYGKLHQGGWGSIRDVAVDFLLREGYALTLRNIRTAMARLARTAGTTEAHNETKFVIPARPFLLIQAEDEEAISDIFIEWMEGLVNEAGRAWEAGV
jgi:phage gpG-like protein